MIKSFNNLKHIKNYYDFSIEINNIDDFKKYYNEEIEVIHKSCKSKFKAKLKYLFSDTIDTVRISSLSYLYEYFDDKIEMKCEKCLQMAKNQYFNEQLESKFKGNYAFDGDFKGISSDVEIIHKVCGTVLKRNAGKLLALEGDVVNCPTCNKFLNRSEKQRYKNIMNMTDKYTFDEDISNIYIFKEYLNKEIGVTHNKCGHHFEIKLNKFFNAKMNTTDNLTNEDNKDDAICPKCMQEMKNKYFQNLLDRKTKGQYELVSDYLSAKDRVKIRHKVCMEEMEISAGNVFCAEWAYKCNTCATILTLAEKRKFDVCNKLIDFYEFPFDITEPYLFKKYLNEEVKIKHKKCGETFIVKLTDFNKLSINKEGPLSKYLDNLEDAKCHYCFQNTKNKYFEDLLHENYGKQYSLKSNYLSTKEDVTIIHNPCGKLITLNASIITRQRRKNHPLCNCSEDNMQKELQKQKNKNFYKKMCKEGASDFELLGNYIDRTTQVLFKHTTCGYEFEVSPENFLKRVNRCPNCTGNKRIIFKDQEEKNEVFQRRLNEKVEGFKLIGDYYNKLEKVTLYHERCHKEFTVDMTNFENTGYKCPCCETMKYKYSKDITLKEKIKCFEREWNYEFKILTGFVNVSDVVTLRHKKCGKTFKTQIVNVLSREDKTTVCPHCELEKRKKIFLKKLEDKFGSSYKLIGEYVTEETPTWFKHVSCKNEFLIKPAHLLKQVLEHCPNCKDEVYRLNNAKKFKNKLMNKYGKDYTMITEYTSHDKKVLFRHNKCDTLFWETPFNMLKKDTPCKKCHKKDMWIPLEEVNKRIRKVNGDRFRIVGVYKGTENSTIISCNACGHEMDLSPAKLFRVRKCPKCDMKKRKQEFAEKLKKKFGDEYRISGAYISIEEPTDFVHVPCGVKFKMIPRQLLNKSVACCSECKEERMKEHYRKINCEKFKKRLINKHEDKYTLIGDYINLETATLFRDNETNIEFINKPKEMLKKNIVFNQD